MLRTLELLKESSAVKSYSVLDFKQGKNFYFLKIKAELADGSELYIREFVSEEEFIYSYHWQDKNGKLRIRWDNAPHHQHIKTFPHHKHTTEIEESKETGFHDVIRASKQPSFEKEGIPRQGWNACTTAGCLLGGSEEEQQPSCGINTPGCSRSRAL